MMTATKVAKSLKGKTPNARTRLTAAEIKALALHFPTPLKTLRLGTATQIRTEMRRVYLGAIDGTLPLGGAVKLVFILAQIAKSQSEEEKLRILERGGIAGAPFVGLTISGPPGPNGEAPDK